MYLPVWAALQALITDYSDLEQDTKKRSKDLNQLIQGTKTFADWLLGFEWEDSYMGCQRKIEQQIDTLRGAMENLPTWQDKLDYLVSSDPLYSMEKRYLDRSPCRTCTEGTLKSLRWKFTCIGIRRRCKLVPLLSAAYSHLLIILQVYQVKASREQVGSVSAL